MIRQDRNQNLHLISQIKTQKIPVYPFSSVCDFLVQQQHLYLVYLAQHTQHPYLIIDLFLKNGAKIHSFTYSLDHIASRKLIRFIKIRKIFLKISKPSVLTCLQLIFGYREGHLIVVELKDKQIKNKQLKIKQKYNKSSKTQGFFSKAGSMLFGGQQLYPVFYQEAIKKIYFDHYFSYLLSNKIIIHKNPLQAQNVEATLFGGFQGGRQNFQKNSNNKQIKLFTVNSSTILECSHNICDFLWIRNYILVGVGWEQSILLIDSDKFTIVKKIKTNISFRKINYLQQINTIVIIPYENYIILYALKVDRYCRLIGHKSFVSNCILHNNAIVCAGLDNRISVTILQELKQQYWRDSIKKNNQLLIDPDQLKGIKHTQSFLVKNKQYKQQINFGFSDFILVNKIMLATTYDSTIQIYAMK